MNKENYDLIVIGAGSDGISAANYAAQHGFKVLVIESNAIGGTCVNVGCVPKKLLWYSANLCSSLEQASKLGWNYQQPPLNWQVLKDNIHRTVDNIKQSYSNKVKKNGIEFVVGSAKISQKNQVSVNGKDLNYKFLLLATGCYPSKLDIPGHEHMLVSDDVFSFNELPKDIGIIGGGYIAVELASILNKLGSNVTLIHRSKQLLKKFDGPFSQILQQKMQNQGIKFVLEANVTKLVKHDNLLDLHLDSNTKLTVNALICAVGRQANLSLLHSSAIDIALTDSGHITVDDNYKTNIKNIYAVGDVINTPELTPVAIREGISAVQDMFKIEKSNKIDYTVIPSTVFSLPQFSAVGLTQEQAVKSYDTEVLEASFNDLKGSLTKTDDKVHLKLLFDKKTSKILGIHMIGEDSSEIIQALSVAVGIGMTKADLKKTMAIHPTIAEEFIYLAQKT